MATAGNLKVLNKLSISQFQFFFIPSYREKARNTE